MNHLPFTSVFFFAGRISLLSSCCVCLRLACWCWCLPVLAHWILRSALRASIWGSHIEPPYKKQQLKKAMLLAFYGGPAGFV
jgi:hypothetical protein